MLKLWGRLNSINVQKVVWCLEEIGVEYERVEAGLQHGVVNTAEYGTRNPNRLVPTIEDDGFTLWESNAIVRYLAARYSSGALSPEDPQRRADADRWMDWQTTTFQPAAGPAFMQLVRTAEAARDPRIIEAARDKAESCAAILDAELGRRPYIAGETFTMGDIPVGCSLHRWLNLPLARVPRPNVERYYAALEERPATGRIFTPLS